MTSVETIKRETKEMIIAAIIVLLASLAFSGLGALVAIILVRT